MLLLLLMMIDDFVKQFFLDRADPSCNSPKLLRMKDQSVDHIYRTPGQRTVDSPMEASATEDNPRYHRSRTAGTGDKHGF